MKREGILLTFRVIISVLALLAFTPTLVAVRLAPIPVADAAVTPLAESSYNALVGDFRYQQRWHVYLAANPHLCVQFYGVQIDGFAAQQAAYVARYDQRLAAVEVLYAGDDSTYAWLIADLQKGRLLHAQWAHYYEANPGVAAAANQAHGQRQMVALYDQRIALVNQLAANN